MNRFNNEGSSRLYWWGQQMVLVPPPPPRRHIDHSNRGWNLTSPFVRHCPLPLNQHANVGRNNYLSSSLSTLSYFFVLHHENCPVFFQCLDQLLTWRPFQMWTLGEESCSRSVWSWRSRRSWAGTPFPRGVGTPSPPGVDTPCPPIRGHHHSTHSAWIMEGPQRFAAATKECVPQTGMPKAGWCLKVGTSQARMFQSAFWMRRRKCLLAEIWFVL